MYTCVFLRDLRLLNLCLRSCLQKLPQDRNEYDWFDILNNAWDGNWKWQELLETGFAVVTQGMGPWTRLPYLQTWLPEKSSVFPVSSKWTAALIFLTSFGNPSSDIFLG